MPRETSNEEIRPDQRRSFTTNAELEDRDGEIVMVERLTKEYADELAFMEEPVTIRLGASAQKNAANLLFVSVNGIGAEVQMNGRWVQLKYLPTGQELTTKRKYVEPILRAKIDRIETSVEDRTAENPINRVIPYSSPIASCTITGDTPKGHAWAAEMMKRYY